MCSSIKYFQSQQNDRDIKIDDVLHPGSPLLPSKKLFYPSKTLPMGSSRVVSAIQKMIPWYEDFPTATCKLQGRESAALL